MTGRTAVNGQFGIIRTSKCEGQVIKFFAKLSETSLKAAENCAKLETVR